MREFFHSLTRNLMSLIGVALTTVSVLLTLLIFLLDLLGFIHNPYIGIVAYLVMPAFFMAGLILIPIGIMREKKRALRAEERGESAPTLPVIDLNQPRSRNRALTFILLSVANLVILATVAIKGVELMDTTAFCGTTCHSVMQPEHTAHQRSPHARVTCTSCHIGPGASWFVKSKLSGAWQVIATAFDLYPRPIPTPVHDLRPARETCEQCHWPTKFVGDRLKVITSYANDEVNSELKSVLLLRVGGIEGRKSQGIHWHVDPNIEIRYLSDAKRETVYDIELASADGTVKRFASGTAPEDEGHGERIWRVMDCVDCHNRPTHIYQTPEKGIDEAIREGVLSRDLPFVRREGLRLLTADYPSHEEARRAISAGISAFYVNEYPEIAAAEAPMIEQAGLALGDTYCNNVFPVMKVEWGTYPDHIGHTQSDGCFRCHDDMHETESGEAISQDCFTCHSLLALEEEDPEILQQLQP
jgi:hypothetical protein